MNRAPLTQEAVEERLKQIGDLRHLSGYIWEYEPSVAAHLIAAYRRKLIKNEDIDVKRTALGDVMRESKGRVNPNVISMLIDEFQEWALTVVRSERSKQ